MARSAEAGSASRSGDGRHRSGPEDDLETIDLDRPPGPLPAPRPGPTLPGRPPARPPANHPTTVRPHRLPPPPLTDVDFQRWVFAPFDSCRDRVADWAAARSASGLVREGDRVRLTVSLRPVPWRPPVAMELLLDRAMAPFGAKLTLRPLGEVHAGRRYFRAGHAVLDALESVLEEDQPPAPAPAPVSRPVRK